MELTFQTFQKPAAYGDQRKLVIQDNEVLAKPVTRGWHRIEKQQVNQRLVQAMKAEGLDDDIIRYSIGFETREKNWDRKLEKFKKGGIRLTARAMKIISDRTEICILRNREANKQFISKTISESFLKENIPNWNSLGKERQQGIIQTIPQRLERMGLDGKHRLTNEDAQKAIEKEWTNYRLTTFYRNHAGASFVQQIYQSLPADSRHFPENQLPLRDLVSRVQDAIQKHYLSGQDVTYEFTEKTTKSILMRYEINDNVKALLARKNEVTIGNLDAFSLDKMRLQNFQTDLTRYVLIFYIQDTIEKDWTEKGPLDQDAIDEIYRKHITEFQAKQEQQVAKAQELAEKMAGQKLPNLMEALQEK
jgi:hypothetical protein